MPVACMKLYNIVGPTNLNPLLFRCREIDSAKGVVVGISAIVLHRATGDAPLVPQFQ